MAESAVTLAADAGEQDVEGRLIGPGIRQHRLGQRLARLRHRLLHRLGADQGDEGGAEALDATQILVAGALVDLALAAELGLDRLHREAVGGAGAIAAILADPRVDRHALHRLRLGAALALAAPLRRALLVVDQHGDAGDLAQLPLHRIQVAAVVVGDALRHPLIALVPRRIVGDDDDLRRALGRHLRGDLRHAQLAFRGLPAGHGDGAVDQDLVGHVGAGGDGLADRQRARMGIGAVADIHEHMFLGDEGRHAEPGHALRAHMRIEIGLPVHVDRQGVAADTGHRVAAFRHARAGVVRAAWAEMRRAVMHRRRLQPGQRIKLGDARLQLLGLQRLRQPRGQRSQHRAGVELGQVREQAVALLVALAGDPWVGHLMVERVAELRLDHRAAVLDHQDLLQPMGESRAPIASSGQARPTFQMRRPAIRAISSVMPASCSACRKVA
ncbi:hypothetical protein ACFQU2_29150 [Siccirubricoccus deserti]